MNCSKASARKILSFAVVLFLTAPVYGAAQANASTGGNASEAEQSACKALMDIPDLTIIQAEIRNLGKSDTPYCYVRGIMSGHAIGFHVQLPLPRNWKGRFVMEGNANTAGQLSFYDSRVAEGDVAANTNTGHDAGAEPRASFGLEDLQAKIDFAYRAVHLTVNAAKAVIKAYYGAPARHSYFEGCSTGGREAFTEAQRYPNDFDGIVAGDPSFEWIEDNMQNTYYMQEVYRNNFAANLAFSTHGDGKFDSLTKIHILYKAVMDKCDALDGIKDGVIDDPTKCKFDPEVELADKMCKGDVNADGCFTKAQMQFIKDLYSGPHDSRGNQLYWGKPLGFEEAELVHRYILYTGNNNGNSQSPDTLNSMDRLNYFFYDESPGVPPPPPDMGKLSYKLDTIKNPPEWAWWNFNVDDWTAGKAKQMTALFDANDPDLKSFLIGNNGKFIIYHGWIDGGTSPLGDIQYYKNVVTTTFGGDQKAADDRVRLFMVPGMGHCRGGPGPNEWDKLAPLVDWVENGKAPDSIVAQHKEAGKVTNERPLCPYPQHAIYTGPAGGQNDPTNWVAKNFTCRRP